MADGIGGREGRQASENTEHLDVSQPFSATGTRRENRQLRSTNYGYIDLDTCPDNDVDVICEVTGGIFKFDYVY